MGIEARAPGGGGILPGGGSGAAGNFPSRRRGRSVSRFGLLLGQELGHLQERKHDRYGPLRVNRLGFVRRQIRTQSYFHLRNDSDPSAMRDSKE